MRIVRPVLCTHNRTLYIKVECGFNLSNVLRNEVAHVCVCVLYAVEYMRCGDIVIQT